MPPDVERLARAQERAALPFGRLLRLYLDPFALFKSTTSGPPAAQAEALHYNRRRRRYLLPYARRWALIAVACVTAMVKLVALARGEPLLWIPIAGLEIGFSTALCIFFLCLAVYFVLGLKD